MPLLVTLVEKVTDLRDGETGLFIIAESVVIRDLQVLDLPAAQFSIGEIGHGRNATNLA